VNLYPHQLSGIEWLYPRSRAGLIDEQGLGKTITAIVAAQKAGVRSMLVVCPTVVAWNWQREIQRWAPEWTTEVCVGFAALGKAFLRCPVPDVVIVTHTGIIDQGAFKLIGNRAWDLVVLDEAHVFRNESAQRTRAFYGRGGIASHSKRVWILTGTPMPNNVSELWTHLRALWPERCPYGFEEFRQKFCELEWDFHRDDWKVIGNKNLPELKTLMQGLFLRRLKKDHLSLPPIRFETVVLPPPRMPEGNLTLLRRIDGMARKALTEHGLEAAIEVLKQNEEFARYRRLCGLAKVEPAAELLTEELIAGEKLVVAAHHLEVLEGLREALERFHPVMFTGAISATQRQANVDTFQTDPRCQLALCQIQAGGVGITLTAANEVVMIEQSFVPGENAQLVDRIHRIGQHKQVRARFLSLAGSVDELLCEALARKTMMVSEVLSGIQ
jgi:SWI/SNF-related matrix-associated actin-dependent regulator 1 of chromatin subfamily A